MKKYKYEFIVLLASAIIMVLELTATRILSPYVGTSNIVWTSIIGIILASMSLGYYFGGILSDKRPDSKILSLIILITGVYIGLIPLMEVSVIHFLSESITSLKVGSLVCSIILFAIPSLLLASVYPYCMKLKEIEKDDIGKISGRLSFYSTLGSIIGTFLTGFVLLPLIGNKMIIMLIAIISLLLSFVINRNNIKNILLVILGVIVVFLSYVLSIKIIYYNNENLLLDKDTEYNRVFVSDLYDNNRYIGRELRVGKQRQSLHNDDLANIYYYNYFDLMKYFNPDFENVLLIGAGAYSYPILFAETYPDKNLDVVEIDGQFIEIAKKYFEYEGYNNVNTITQDGRGYLNKNEKKYDVILLDAYKETTAPFELTTMEAINEIKKSLTDDGVIITNIMGATVGENSMFLKSEYKTYKEQFDEVFLMTYYPNNDDVRPNILVGFKNYDQPYIDMIENELKDTVINDFEVGEEAIILTDDYAPVEYYISKYVS